MQEYCRFFALLILLLSNGFVIAEVPVRNYNPFALMVGLTELRSAALLPVGSYQISMNSTISNQWDIESSGSETLFVDGEVHITDFDLRYGFSAFELLVNIPWLVYQKGRLDPLVEDFHDIFSMPNAGREDFKQNQLLFTYANDNTGESLRMDQPVSGFGDARISLAAQLKRTDTFATSLGMQLKLANANEDQWLGSGSYDLSLYNNVEWLRDNWQTQMQMSLLIMQDKGFLQGQKKDVAGTLGMAVNYNMTSQLWWVLQYDAHTSLFNGSNIKAMGPGQMISIAVAWRGKAWGAHFAVLEDIDVGSVPDVGFQFGLKIKL